ncbi:MAG: hypothetical protein ACR2PK_12590 [Acidimicrobiales bacterium]
MAGALAAVLVAALVLAACGSEVTASGFEADPAPIDPNMVTALGDTDDPEAVPEVQRNFLTGCVKGFDSSLPQMEPVQTAGLLQVCGCTYDRLVGYSYDQARDRVNESLEDQGSSAEAALETFDDAAFEVFTSIEEDLRSGDSDLPDEVFSLIRDCIRSEAGL